MSRDNRADHWDVAAYALGVLDERDTERFEEHLVDCWACAAELESMLPVVELLAEVDSKDLVTPDRAASDGQLLDRMVATVSAEHKPPRGRRYYALAASVVLVAMVTGAALFAGGQWLAGARTPSALPGTSPTATASPQPDPGTGIGGPEVEGESVGATDPTTGVRADLILNSMPFGTQVSFALARVNGPLVCRMVVLRKSGTAEVLSTWSVPPAGYGTAAQPRPLTLQATTAIPRSDFDRVQVQSINANGEATALVTVTL